MEGLIDGVLPADEATYLHVYNEADRLGRLVDDLQELSRVEAGAYELTFRGVAVSKLIEGVVDRLVQQFKEKHVLLETNLAPDMPLVWVDEHRIGQVLINLLGNALQYTPSGGKVCISAAHLGDEVHISISDTGIGIHPEHLSDIFTRFYRVDKSRSRVGGGSGIGLTIARYLVESHGGRIWVESPGLNQGSTFTFTLPVAK
jgi:histidine kinase